MGTIRYRRLKDCVVLVIGTTSPCDAEWDLFLRTLIGQCHEKGAVSLLVLSHGGGPTALQRASLTRLFAGFPFQIGLIQTGAANQALLTSLGWLQASAFVYTLDALDEATAQFGLVTRDLQACLRDLSADLHRYPSQAA